jgi:hypothetical protein
LTDRPLSPNAVAAKLMRAKMMFSGGPCRITIMCGAPVVKLTEVSEGGGPDVSSTMTRASGSIRETAGDDVGVGTGALDPHAPRTTSQVARLFRLRNIPRILKVRGER